MRRLPLTEFQRMTLRYTLFVVKKSMYVDNNGRKQSMIGGLSDDECQAIDDLYEELTPEDECKEAEI